MKTSKNFTRKELAVIRAMFNEYSECEFRDKQIVGYNNWLCIVSEYSYSGKTFSGVCSSLTEKGAIGIMPDGNDSTIWLTEKGFEMWMEDIDEMSDDEIYRLWS